MAKYSESQNRATQKYIHNNYDQMAVRVPKGDRERYKAHAEKRGISLNQLIIDLIETDIKKSW